MPPKKTINVQTKGSIAKSTISKNDIKRGILYCNSKVQLAEYLGIGRVLLWKLLREFKDDDGRLMIDVFEEKIKTDGRGFRKSMDRKFIIQLLEDGILGTKAPAPLIKKQLIEEKYLQNKCYCCGYKDKRDSDAKSALLLNFIDGNKLFWKRENLEILCYNCYFTKVGDLLFPDQLEALEFWGIQRSKAVYNDIVSDQSLKAAIQHKEELQKMQEELEKMEEASLDIIAYKKFKN